MKDAIKILLIVALVFFGMSMLTKSCQPKPDNSDTTALAGPDDDNSGTSADFAPLSPSEIAIVNAPEAIRKAGKADDATGAVTFVYENVSLSLKGDSAVEGIVNIDDTTTVTYAELLSGSFNHPLTNYQKGKAAKAVRDALEFAGKNGALSQSMLAPESAETVTLENKQVKLQFANRGGYISQATLKNYFTYFDSKTNPDSIDKKEVNMYRPEYKNAVYYGFELITPDQVYNSVDLNFTPRQVNDSVVEMTVAFGEKSYWGYRYTLHSVADQRSGENFLITVDVIQKNMNGLLSNSMNAPHFRWHNLMPRQDKSRTFEERNSSVYYKYVSDSPDDLGLSTDDTELKHGISWIAFKNQFFSSVIIPRTPFSAGYVAQASFNDSKGEYADFVKDMDANLVAEYDINADVAMTFDMYIGPNDYNYYTDLDKVISPDSDLDLTRLVPLGWSWLRWINTLIIIPIFSFLSEYITNYGIIILILTIIIKIILFPFTYKSYLSQAKMRLLAPEIKEINEKYPGQENAMVRNQKTMALYSRAGASPMSGCLPLMLQMPILIAMFSFFPSCIELRGQSFLWAKDLAAPDVIFTLPFSIPFYGSHVRLFCLMMTITNIIYTQINMKSQPSSSSMPGMKWMMYLMPLMFLVFFNAYAAALSYYYFLSLLITIVQT
ncbi:MAG: membrane protein insertase YidC, partial [Muribaculaceae bacterium]|nr:membrane protein insertase YidC [Muribaculaceae bacterium]